MSPKYMLLFYFFSLNGKADKALTQTAGGKRGSSLALGRPNSRENAHRSPQRPRRTIHAPRQAPKRKQNPLHYISHAALLKNGKGL